MSQPILFLVDDRPQVLGALAADLGRRFGADHRILTAGSPWVALEELLRLAEQAQEVALVVAGQAMAAMPGVQLLVQAHDLHPGAKQPGTSGEPSLIFNRSSATGGVGNLPAHRADS